MLTKDELLELLTDTETSRAERTASTTDTDKFCEAICAFANDMPDSRRNGYLLIGAHDDGRLSGLRATDALLKNLASIRSDGNILPIPQMNVETFRLDGGDVVVVEVAPALLPPVRYRGRTWIRVGPRRAIATIEEEERLVERRRSRFPTFDSMPCPGARLDDLDLDLFRHGYLPKAFDAETLASESRPIERQLEALCFHSTESGCPTNAGIILFGRNPLRFLPGDYIQFVQFAGTTRGSDILNQRDFRGGLVKVLPEIDAFIQAAVVKSRPVPVTVLREKTVSEYPKWSIRELMMNAVMHRDYRSTGPTMVYQYSDRIEILNSGGLYGRVNPAIFPDENDYRNPIVADAMRTLGYVNRFGRGIGRVRTELAENGNGEPIFETGQIGSFRVVVGRSRLAETNDENRAGNNPESSQKMAERAGKTVECAEKTEERAEKTVKSAEKIRTWAAAAIPPDVRQDARANMTSILVEVGKDPEITTEKLQHLTGLSDRGVRKNIASLRSFGLLIRIGPDKGGHWELLGFEH